MEVLLQWLAREIPLLQNLIDRANEKGWRREYPFMLFLDYTRWLKILAISVRISHQVMYDGFGLDMWFIHWLHC